LLTDERSGYANPRCYARASNDCDEELMREHFNTHDLLSASVPMGRSSSSKGLAAEDRPAEDHWSAASRSLASDSPRAVGERQLSRGLSRATRSST
jgi:hypothetical protein